MTEQERINNEVQIRLANHDAKFDKVMDKLDDFHREMKDFKDEMKDFKQEMRQQNEMRANEIAEIRGTFQNIQNTLLQMQISNRNQNVLVVIGVAAMVIAVILK